MKKLFYLFLITLLSTNIFAQETDIIVYGASNNINFYSLSTNTSHQNLLELGPTPNQIYYYNNRVFVVNSGSYGANTNIQIIPIESFKSFEASLDTAAFRNSAVKIMLEDNGNGYTAIGLTDSTVLVTLAQSPAVQEVNYLTNTVSPIISVPAGNPQGSSMVNDSLVAFTLADWTSSGAGGVSIFNKNTKIITKTINTHINNVEVYKLANNDLLSIAWGTWFGDGNFGTLEYIDAATLEVSETLYMQDSAKANYIVEINDTTIFVEGFDAAYATVSGILNPETKTYTPAESGFYKKHIIGKLHNGNLIVGVGTTTEVYNAQQTLVSTIPVNVGSKNVPVMYPQEVPVELLSFTAIASENSVQLNWQTATETNNMGFKIYRDGKELAFVEGNGTVTNKQHYSFTDNNLEAGSYNYKLQQIDFDGTYEFVGNITATVNAAPVTYNLSQNYPNPFNPSTTIKFTIPVADALNASTTLKVYDVLGNEVATLFEGTKSAGTHEVNFNASNLASGIYFYTLSSGDFVSTMKMMLLK